MRTLLSASFKDGEAANFKRRRRVSALPSTAKIQPAFTLGFRWHLLLDFQDVGRVLDPTGKFAILNKMAANYNLDRLGWKNFQHLCGTILRESMGQTFQTFADGNDAGQDGAFWGTWTQQSGEVFSGSFTVQCKHTSKPDSQFRISVIREELEKAKLLADRGLADNYLFLTNYSISGNVAQRVQQAFEALPGITRCRVYERSWIEDQIHSNKNLRSLAPRLYGLGDLTQILDERAYEQAQAILKHLGNDFSCFVPTKAHSDSVGAMNDKGFVFLLGEPCCGKSTIALSLALASVDLWGCNLVRVDKPSHFRDHWNPRDPKQFFWVDDAFGTTQYEREMALEWNRHFPALQTAISKGARVVFTSRDYIYKAAMDDLKEASFPLLRDSKVVIRVEQISASEREQILYNHIKLGEQPKAIKKAMQESLAEIAAHERFLPETARRLGDPFFTGRLKWDQESLLDFVENMKDFLLENLRTFGDANRAAVALVFMRKGTLPSDLTLSEREQHAVSLLGSNVGQIRTALAALSPTLLLNTEQEGESCWKFKHPSVRDAFGAFIAEDPSLRDIYLENTELRSLLAEIACGPTEIEGVKLKVPGSLYPIVLDRLKELDLSDKADFAMLVQFLRNRADGEFLKAFVSCTPKILSRLNCRSWMRYNNATMLAAKLHSFGLLPEKERKKIAKQISANTIWHGDAACYVEPNIAALLKPDEQRNLKKRVTGELMSRLRDLITETKQQCLNDDLDASDEFWTLRRNIGGFERAFFNRRSFRIRLVKAERRIDRIVATIGRKVAKNAELLSGATEEEKISRSIFDDVAD